MALGPIFHEGGRPIVFDVGPIVFQPKVDLKNIVKIHSIWHACRDHWKKLFDGTMTAQSAP